MQQFKRGNKYKRANKTISIWILDGEVYDFLEYHSKWKIYEETNGKTKYFDDFEIHVIELKKFRRENIIEPKRKEFWLWFIDHTKREMVEMSYSLGEIRKAKAEYEKMIEGNETVQYLLIKEEMDELDRNTMIASAERKVKRETAKKLLEKGIDIETIIEATGLTKEEIESITS